jgi:hypothetical protein
MTLCFSISVVRTADGVSGSYAVKVGLHQESKLNK